MKLMNRTFNSWKKQHDSEDMNAFSYDKEGLLWLKIKSIIRKDLLLDFALWNICRIYRYFIDELLQN